MYFRKYIKKLSSILLMLCLSFSNTYVIIFHGYSTKQHILYACTLNRFWIKKPKTINNMSRRTAVFVYRDPVVFKRQLRNYMWCYLMHSINLKGTLRRTVLGFMEVCFCGLFSRCSLSWRYFRLYFFIGIIETIPTNL